MPRQDDPYLFRRSPTGPWWFEFQYGGTRYRETTNERDRRRALQIARQRRAQIQAGEPLYRNRLREARLVDLFAAEIVEAEQKDLARGYRKALAIYHNHLVTFFGRDATLAAVTYDNVREYEAWRREAGVRGQSIREEVAALKRAFQRARRRKLVRVGLEEWPEIRSDAPDPRRVASAKPYPQIAALLAALDDEVRGELIFSALTGLRREELPEVRWSWIRKEGRQAVLVVPQDARKAGHDLPIPLVASALRAATARRLAQGKEARDADAPLFPKRDWRKRIAKACKASGAPWVTYRNLRGTVATRLNEIAGPMVSRDVLGHGKVEMTGRYIETSMEDRREGLEEIDADLSAAIGKARRRRK